MKSIKNFFSSAAEVCNPKKGTISGVMDVIVIRRPDGSMASTPFHVKFGRFKVMKSNKIKVDIYINKQKSEISMELIANGRAVFIRKSDSDLESTLQKSHSAIDSSSLLVQNELCSPRDSLNSSQIIRDHSLPPSKKEDEEEKKIGYLPFRSREVSLRSYRINTGIITPNNQLTSQELISLNLKIGMNTIDYVANTKKSPSLSGRIYLWEYNSKIVVSDIDGTLTKSDILGHICYAIGKDWNRGGVVSLYNNIIDRGYKILYLSSRSISQVESTKKYLSLENQLKEKLPDGPVLLSSDGMFKCIVREIGNHSQSFKQNTLIELLQTFPLHIDPFYAGFGNKEGDALAYFHIGIPKNRIFILKTSKKLKKEDYNCIKTFDDDCLNLEEVFPVIT
jgi:phosphatidate phosphatase PAH1